MATAQLNVRIDADLKAAGDSVLDRFGVSSVQIVRSAWQYMADHQKLPSFAQKADVQSPDKATAQISDGAGMAIKLAREAGLRAEFEAMSYDELRESAFEEMMLEKAERHA